MRSYAERLFDYRAIGRLAPADAREAFTAPAGKLNADFEDETLTHLVEVSGRYPSFIQEFGSAIWTVAEQSPFTLHDAHVAANLGTTSLDSGFFPSRWERATPAERGYLVAMSKDGEGPPLSSTVAKRMGREPSSLGPARANLIAKGLIYAPEHGKIAFTALSFHLYIGRRADQEAL